MSLPSGYKRLEYIQSTGTQYVDSGFKPNSNTKVVADYYTTSKQGAVIGSDNSWLNSDFVIEVHFAAFCSTMYGHSSVPSGRHVATLDKGVFSLDGKTLTTMAGTFTGSYNLTLFALNRSNSIQEYGTLRLYSCQIYDNWSICRDFIPCQKTDGTVGLWDDANSVFYGNAGTGTFAAGPAVAIAAAASEITELEYIESSGAQYVDTLFKANNNTRVVMDAQLTSVPTSNISLFGGRTAAKEKNYSLMWIPSYFRSDYGTVYTQQWSVSSTERRVFDKNKETTTIDGTSQSYQNSAFQCDYSLFLLAENNAGSVTWFASAKLYSCQIYDNGIIIRAYIAAKLSDGTVGLYDKLHGLLYINLGSGAFTAGPEVPKAPSAPAFFTASALTDTTVQLIWAASDGAAGYKLYKNGDLLATLTDTSYTDTVQAFSGTVYSITAYNADGESEETVLTYYSMPENPILYLVTDRTAEDVTARNVKGTYRSADLNRVGFAVQYLAEYLGRHGTQVHVSPKRNWTDIDHPTLQTMTVCLADIATLRAALKLPEETPNVPDDMEKLSYWEANDIELILVVLDDMIGKMLSIVDAGWTGGMAYTGFYFKEATT